SAGPFMNNIRASQSSGEPPTVGASYGVRQVEFAPNLVGPYGVPVPVRAPDISQMSTPTPDMMAQQTFLRDVPVHVVQLTDMDKRGTLHNAMMQAQYCGPTGCLTSGPGGGGMAPMMPRGPMGVPGMPGMIPTLRPPGGVVAGVGFNPGGTTSPFA